jgi:AraC family transcriptional regulator
MAIPDLQGHGQPEPPRRVVHAGTSGITDYPPGAIHGPRALDDYEFVWLIRGGATVATADAKVEISPGQLVLIAPDQRHTIFWNPWYPTRHGYVHFRSLIPEGALRVPWLQRRAFTTEDPLAAMCRYLIWLAATRMPGWQERADRCAAALLEAFLEGPLPAPQTHAAKLVASVLQYVAGCWADGMRTISLRELADAASISEGHLNRTFRRQVGAGAVSTLELIRLARAEQLLSRSGLRIGEVAAATGFADAYHFSRRFRRVFGVPPSAIRSASEDRPLPEPIVRVLPLVDQLAHV